MHAFELCPLLGVGDIHFGLLRNDVHRILGAPERSFQKTATAKAPTDAWFSSCLQVFYSGERFEVVYIELSRGTSVKATCYGIDVFESQSELSGQLAARGFVADEEENGCTLVYRAAQLALWRPSNDAEFATVGIGAVGYFD